MSIICRVFPVFLLLAFGITNTHAIGPFPINPYISEDTWFYDLDGQAGLAFAGEIDPKDAVAPPFGNQVLGGRLELYRVGEEDPFFVENDFLSTRANLQIPDGMEMGSPYYVRRVHPYFGCISTSNFVGLAWGSGGATPGVVIPYHSQSQPDGFSLPSGVPEADREVQVFRWLGTSQRRLLDYLTTQTVTIIIDIPYIADQRSSPSLVVDARALALVDGSTTASATIESQGIAPFVVETNRPHGTVGMLVFGKGFEGFFEEHWRPDLDVIHWVSEDVPSEILLTPGLARYETEPVAMELTPGKDYRWRPLFIPAEGSGAPHPGMEFPESVILDRGAADQILGDCLPGATLAGAVDSNRDGVHDAADVVAAQMTNEE